MQVVSYGATRDRMIQSIIEYKNAAVGVVAMGQNSNGDEIDYFCSTRMYYNL